MISQMRKLPNLINFNFQACFGNACSLSESSSFWKQATANSIQDDKQFPFQTTSFQRLVMGPGPRLKLNIKNSIFIIALNDRRDKFNRDIESTTRSTFDNGNGTVNNNCNTTNLNTCLNLLPLDTTKPESVQKSEWLLRLPSLNVLGNL